MSHISLSVMFYLSEQTNKLNFVYSTFLYSTRPFSGKYESGSVGQISLDQKCHFSVDQKFCLFWQ